MEREHKTITRDLYVREFLPESEKYDLFAPAADAAEPFSISLENRSRENNNNFLPCIDLPLHHYL
jgi:hypothetical protein